MQAAMNGNNKCVSALVRLLVDINAKNNEGRTALHEVREKTSSNFEIVVSARGPFRKHTYLALHHGLHGCIVQYCVSDFVCSAGGNIWARRMYLRISESAGRCDSPR